ncbi:MAG TPA: peptidase U32 family protein, partial [Flavisolibacter sp.]|nr:peptidase U32 family protein [Flavisolibacter sp.]
MKNNKIELLSPVGSFECLHAAINAGADSIYFGVEQLNMRARSVNAFTIKDIKEIISIAHQKNVKAFLTLNTVMYEHDMQLLQTVLKEVKKRNVDAVIASDFAVIRMCNELGIPLHISTQANVCNLESVLFFAAFSDVIVLARELTLKQVEQLSREISRRGIKGVSGEPLRLEVFVHGALCMAVSGKCYLSLHQQNASANRGACLQNCRRSYKIIDTETNQELLVDNEYILSAKDLCTIDILDQVVKSGVGVIKIEGRTKGPEYVYTTTKCYREALDAIACGSYSLEKIDAWKKELEKVYNRGFWEGYYLGRKLGEWTKDPGSMATEKKVYVGKGTKYYPGIGVGEFIVEAGTVKKGDTIMVTGPAFGLVQSKMEALVVNGKDAIEAIKGDKITFTINEKIT